MRKKLGAFRIIGFCWYCNGIAEAIHHFNWDHHDDREENRIPVCTYCHVEIHKHGVTWHPRWKRRLQAHEYPPGATVRRDRCEIPMDRCEIPKKP